MFLATLAGVAARPSSKTGDAGDKVVLADIVPSRFGGWSELATGGTLLVNPQTQQLLDKLYSQILTRTYVNADGYRVMLSIAYGDDQRGELALHKPEVCYPAQGFTVHANEAISLRTPFGEISARQLQTSLGRRVEPVTYWVTVGNSAISNRLEQRLVQIKLGLSGQVPDGLLFRISSIDDHAGRAFRIQEAFATDLLEAVSARHRARLSGISARHGRVD